MTLSFASTDTYVEEEKLIYPLESLVGVTFPSFDYNLHLQVSEIGGALGLFLGFSFLGVFETVSNFCLKLTSMLKIKH